DVHAGARAGHDLGVAVALDRLDLLALAELEILGVGLGTAGAAGRSGGTAGVVRRPLGHVEAHDEPVLAGPVYVVLLAVLAHDDERLAVADVAARVDEHPLALAGRDLHVGVPLEGLERLVLLDALGT